VPILILTLAAQTRLNEPDALAQALTTLSAEVLHKQADVTAVVFQRSAPQSWWVGAQQVHQPVYFLEIRITQGTNSVAEKEAFIAQAHDLLCQHLNDGRALPQANYVCVQELPATDWGYAGRTQEARRQMRQRL
jgi:4-oxalocrotonate tautomerase